MKNYCKILTKNLIVVTLICCLGLFSVKKNNNNKIIATPLDEWEYENVEHLTFVGAVSDDIYYSDEYFMHDANLYDAHLATLSLILAKYSINQDLPKNDNDISFLLHQADQIKSFLNTLGFTNFMANEDYYQHSSMDTLAIAIASKKIDDTTLIAIVPRSGGYFSEWGNNFLLGDGQDSNYMHEGYYQGAIKLIDFLKEYIAIEGIKGTIKVWSSGFGRGGAIVNLASGILDASADNQKISLGSISLDQKDLFTYTFNSTMGANYNSVGMGNPHDELYHNIWNIVDPFDITTRMPFSEFGFTRFGTDKYVASSFFNQSTEQNIQETLNALSTYYYQIPYQEDEFKVFKLSGLNELLIEKNIATIANRLNNLETKIFNLISFDDTKVNYDTNIALTLIVEALAKVVSSREDYVNNYQTDFCDLFILLMKNKVGYQDIYNLLQSLILGAICQTSGFNINYNFLKLYFSQYPDNIDELNKKLIGLFVDVYKERPNEMLSIGKYLKQLINNHESINLSLKLMAQDSFYLASFNETNDSPLEMINLLDDLTMKRIVLNGYNDLIVKDEQGVLVDVLGSAFSKSIIKKCDDNFALGIYQEKIELFVLANANVSVIANSFSKDIYHKVSYDLYLQNYQKTWVLGDTMICSFNTPTQNIILKADQ